MLYSYGSEKLTISEYLPVLPVRDTIVFPYMVYPMIVGRQFSVEALQESMLRDKQILLLAQKDKEIENPKADDLYQFGTVSRVLQVMKLSNGTMKVLMEGIGRAAVKRLTPADGFIGAHIRLEHDAFDSDDLRLEALSRTVTTAFTDYVNLNRRLPDEILSYTTEVGDPGKLADVVAAHVLLPIELRQRLLETVSVTKRLELLAGSLSSEIQILKLEQEIDSGVRESLNKTQREFYLQHQLKVIKEELGQFDDAADVTDYEERIAKAGMPETVAKKASEEVTRLSRMHSYSAEANVIRGYLDWLLAMPWKSKTPDRTDFTEVEKILDGEHFGLAKAKRRILEHLAVIKLAKNVKGPILCLVGPPGVGKTSLGKSIAHALDRKFARMSLGGMRDEAEIRGHRRTYIGAMPGRIVQMLKKVGSANPVFLLDEIDKIGMDFHGDPASALLEVLDPEQNATFQDHYLECEFDLSHILFVTTANTTTGIPRPLLDRMEMIELPGYLEFEKVQIAEQFLIPKQKIESGLEKRRITIARPVLGAIIRDYTRESGVRELERQIGTIMRQIAQRVAKGDRKKTFTVTRPDLRKYLGVRKYFDTELGVAMIGKAIGLAWTRTGGEILPVEVTLTEGTGRLTLTGKLGEVMQESVRAALTYLKSKAHGLKIEKDVFKNTDIHLHLPEGAVPKDGPSAGITVLVALCSAFTKRYAAKGLAYTGEITLSGEVLPVGGLNAKLISAVR
ncbi:MAG: endopeptidase La, partial [candidate division Zixibacteria bacterium]|nr:endopeptidase La [candidate division Zixibacteria bacterium]